MSNPSLCRGTAEDEAAADPVSVRGPLAAAAAVGLAAVALQLRDPHRHGSWGFCPFKALTGWDCPLCGGLRAVNDLGGGHLAAAAHSNLLLIVSTPVALAIWLAWLGRARTGAPRPMRPATRRLLLTAYVVVALAFMVVRNTAWGSTLHAS